MTDVVIRQRGQLTIPRDIVEAAGLEPGTHMDLHYANGVIVLRPFRKGAEADDLMSYAGIARDLWGSTDDEVEAWIAREREASDRPDLWDHSPSRAESGQAPA